MRIGVCELELFIGSSASLKEKRFVVKSIKDHVRHRFNVSIAEVDHQDKWQLAGLGMTTVVTDEKIARHTFDEIFRWIESRGEAEVIKQNVRIL